MNGSMPGCWRLPAVELLPRVWLLPAELLCGELLRGELSDELRHLLLNLRHGQADDLGQDRLLRDLLYLADELLYLRGLEWVRRRGPVLLLEPVLLGADRRAEAGGERALLVHGLLVPGVPTGWVEAWDSGCHV